MHELTFLLLTLMRFVQGEKQESRQVTFIYIVLYAIQIQSKQFYNVKQKSNFPMMQTKFYSVVKQL